MTLLSLNQNSDKTQVEKDTQAVLDICNHIIPYFHQTYFRRYVEDYKAYLGYKGDRARHIEDWQSNIHIPMVATYADTMYNSLYDSKMKFNITGEKKSLETLLHRAFDKNSNGRNNILDAAREAIITGKGFVKPYLDVDTKKIVVQNKEYKRENKMPQITYVSIFNIFYDYNGTIEDSPFIIERHILSEAQLLKRYGRYIEKKNDKEAYIRKILDSNPIRFSEYDYNRVKNILSYEEDVIKNKKETSVMVPSNLYDRHRINQQIMGLEVSSSLETFNNIFAVDFKKNKKYEILEYRDDKCIMVFVDGKFLVKIYQSKFIGKIYDISFGKIPGTSDSTGVASNISDIQTTVNTLQNIFLDGLKMDAAPMFEQVGGLNQMLGKSNKIKYTPYGIVPTNQAGALKKIELGVGGFEPINANQFLEGIAEKRIGVNEYITGGQGKVERVAGGVELIYNQYKSRLMPITDSINQVMSNIAKEYLVMFVQYFTKKELIELGLEDNYTIEEIINEDNISFTLTALALLEKEELFGHIMDNMASFVGLINGQQGENINTQELVKAILTKDVDMEKILDVSEQRQQVQQMQQAQQMQGQGGPQPEQGGQLAELAQNANY